MTAEDVSRLDEATASALVEVAASRVASSEELKRVDKALPARHRLYEARVAHDKARLQQLGSLMATPNLVKSINSLKTLTMAAPLAQIKLPAFAGMNLKLPAISSPLASVRIAPFPDIAKMVREIEVARLPSWTVDESLVRAGIDVPAIHTPAFKPTPRVAPRQSVPEHEKSRLLDAFDSLVQFEFVLREFIGDRLEKAAGAKWWPNRIPGDVVKDCHDRKAEKERPGRPKHRAIFYAYPGDYLKIVLRKDNWQECFKEVFLNADPVSACFLWVGVGRAEIAHVRPLSDSDFGNFMFAVNWLIRTIQEAERQAEQTSH
jgi:hypothetical protein